MPPNISPSLSLADDASDSPAVATGMKNDEEVPDHTEKHKTVSDCKNANGKNVNMPSLTPPNKVESAEHGAEKVSNVVLNQSAYHHAMSEEKKDECPSYDIVHSSKPKAFPSHTAPDSEDSKPKSVPSPPRAHDTLESTSKPVARPPIARNLSSLSVPFISLGSGLQRKASPLTLSSWVALSLTLDGRDKLTKILQYAARFLGWYYESRASSIFVSTDTEETLRNVAKGWRALQKSLTESRKAFRLGRSLIELEKLRAIGLGGVLLWHLKRIMMGREDTEDERRRMSSPRIARKVMPRRASSNIGFEPLETHHEESDEDVDNDERTEKVITRPGRPHLPRRISSNVGWGPSTSPTPPRSEAAATRPFLYRSFSNLVYRPLQSQLSALSSSDSGPTVPAWKVVGSALKLLGLMGFWAGDNFSFLTTSGFFDDYSQSESERSKVKLDRKTRASHFAARSYFAAALAGLYVNGREYCKFRRGKLKESYERLEEGRRGGGDQEELESEFEVARARQFVLFLALLKSCCDVLVFSNNPGVDLHKKYRGRKMNEGFHSVCGLISASTVIYNNFPSSKNN